MGRKVRGKHGKYKEKGERTINAATTSTELDIECGPGDGENTLSKKEGVMGTAIGD